ncbi:hypothetical protein [Streptomyces sp. NPDC050416]|uniref:hypothetical protein n=1 Tax=Streptomyces sp. NPDC050416 TaxID=3365611 RepID=UPI003799453D
MSEETVPQQGGTGQPKGLLQQMEELMAALNADLSALDADLSAAGDADRRPSEEEQVGRDPLPGRRPWAGLRRPKPVSGSRGRLRRPGPAGGGRLVYGGRGRQEVAGAGRGGRSRSGWPEPVGVARAGF